MTMHHNQELFSDHYLDVTLLNAKIGACSPLTRKHWRSSEFGIRHHLSALQADRRRKKAQTEERFVGTRVACVGTYF